MDVSLVYSKLGPVQGARLENFVEQNAKVKRIEDTKIPFLPVATDLNTGETVTLEKGPLAKAIRASSSIPGIFVPVTFGNRTLVDGGVTNNLACDIARQKGADVVIAVNLQRDVKNNDITSLIDVIGQSINIMVHEATKAKTKFADVVIEPDTKGVTLFDFSQKKLLMEEGIKATRAALPAIRQAIASRH
jgi:NTE family protein